MATQKRLFEDLSEIDDTTGVADVQFGIESLSPLKKSRKGADYYDGMVSDGTKSTRLVGFDQKTQEKMDTYYKKGESVMLRNCIIRKGRTSETEIHVNSNTQVEQSPKKFKIAPKVIQDSSVMDILNMKDGVSVNMKAKVMAVEPPRAVGTGLVQDVILCDGINTMSLSVWDDNVNKFEVLQAYHFRNLYTRSYQGIRSLTFSRRSEYEVTGDDAMDNVQMEEDTSTIKSAIIVGVTKFIIHITCLNCSGKLSIIGNEKSSARCSSCNMLQLIDGKVYEVSADVVVQNDEHIMTLKMCTESVLKILHSENQIPSLEMEEQLLRVPKVDITYTKRNNYVKDIEETTDPELF